MCGREPNFELPEDEKQELSKFNWEEFLAFTRSAINNKSKFLFTYITTLSMHIISSHIYIYILILHYSTLQNIEEQEQVQEENPNL